MKHKHVIKEINRYIAKTQYVGLYNIVLQKGKGNKIYDTEGHKYIDFLSGASTACLGYGREDLIKAYAEKARQLTHSCFVYSPNYDAVILAKKLVRIAPGKFQKKVMFGTSASDSIDGAIKASRKYTGRRKIVSFTNAYHGSTGLAGQVTGFPLLHKGITVSSDVEFLHFPATKVQARDTLKEAQKILTPDVACIIFEPVLGDGGNIIPPEFFWKDLQILAKKQKILMIADETQSGMGRSGKWFASQNFHINPDIIVLGKGLGGGYVAISACIGRAKILDSLDKVQHVFTLSGHPPSCAVATKIISIIEKQNILIKVREKSDYFTEKLRRIAKQYNPFSDCEVRGLGLQIGMSIHSKDKEPLAEIFGNLCLEKGLYVGFFGSQNDVVRFHPPLTITKEEIDSALVILSGVFEKLKTLHFENKRERTVIF